MRVCSNSHNWDKRSNQYTNTEWMIMGSEPCDIGKRFIVNININGLHDCKEFFKV